MSFAEHVTPDDEHIKVEVDPSVDTAHILGDSEVEINHISEAKWQLVQQISEFSAEIKCDSFHGLGKLSQYESLLSKISELGDLSQTLNVSSMNNLDTLETSALQIVDALSSITHELTSVLTLDDTQILTSIRDFLLAISNLMATVGNFRIQIAVTAVIKVPDTIEVLTDILNSTKSEIVCVNHFLDQFTGVQPLVDVETGSSKAIVDAITSLDMIKTLGDVTFSSAHLTLSANKTTADDLHQNVSTVRTFTQ
jgi:hypothetical protein